MKRVLVLLTVIMFFMVGLNSLAIAGEGTDSVPKTGDNISDGSGNDTGKKIIESTEDASTGAEKNTSN